ncbi:aspartyl protease family protein [Hasllibacter halocynthiae]|uniref:Aspartyl protease family protein n=1 Tax=Hasllibacter halocynthiae TaxID=595589 RepID=A0A2T0X7N5_9RHOB|nr:TIGR02281 family clan AA aspartic protease [Hasllibacter halocynthiae]PRY94960.1 aspartyl protease family protein [Hasllibacter halocynthiae]
MWTGDDTASLLYLSLLGAFLILVVARGQNLSGFLRYGLIWAAILGIAALGFAAWEDLRDDWFPPQTYLANGAVEVPRARSGHHEIVLRLDGRPVRFLVDTGATGISLPRDVAADVGIDVDALAFDGEAMTANGTVPFARARVGTVALGDRVDRDVPVAVNGGGLRTPLLGMSYLNRFGSVSIRRGVLTLTP